MYHTGWYTLFYDVCSIEAFKNKRKVVYTAAASMPDMQAAFISGYLKAVHKDNPGTKASTILT